MLILGRTFKTQGKVVRPFRKVIKIVCKFGPKAGVGVNWTLMTGVIRVEIGLYSYHITRYYPFRGKERFNHALYLFV